MYKIQLMDHTGIAILYSLTTFWNIQLVIIILKLVFSLLHACTIMPMSRTQTIIITVAERSFLY